MLQNISGLHLGFGSGGKTTVMGEGKTVLGGKITVLEGWGHVLTGYFFI